MEWTALLWPPGQRRSILALGRRWLRPDWRSLPPAPTPRTQKVLVSPSVPSGLIHSNDSQIDRSSFKEHLAAKRDESTTSAVRFEDCGDLTRLVAEIVVHKDELVVRLKSDNTDAASDCPDDRSLSIPWEKPPSKRSRQILLPHNASRSDVRPEQFERRARLVSAIARGRRWLDDVVSGRVTTVGQLCNREKCSVRQVNMTISLAFLAPNLVKAALEGRLPRGIGIERLRDPPTEWSRQFEALGLNPE